MATQSSMKMECDMETPLRQAINDEDSDVTSPVVNSLLPDVVAKTLSNQNLDGRRKSRRQSRQRLSFGTPKTVRSQMDFCGRQNVLEKHLKSSSMTKLYASCSKTSPGLARLRMTPGALKEKQKLLINQHEEIKQRGDQLRAGGGVSMWPDMHQMRLTRSEVVWLAGQAAALCVLTFLLLNKLHGQTFEKLFKFTLEIHSFCESHKMSDMMVQEHFQNQVKGWHTKFLHITSNIQDHFDMSAMSTQYQVYILSYFMGLAVLLYYLLDNMLSRHKLTPSRIKKWTCLLAVIGTWTGMMVRGLYLAYSLELEATRCVQHFSSSLAYLVTSPLDLDMYNAVLLYWRSRVLDSASQGLLSVLGVVSLKYLIYYLQYYCVPIATVIVSPVIKLCCSCVQVYSKGEYFKASS